MIKKKGGTFYHVSMLINQATNSITNDHIINIVDGQNYSSNPCFPIPFNITYKIIINFNTTNIKQFNDWYPSQCEVYDIDNNQYIFQDGHSLIINNLIVHNYSQLSIIQSDEIQCNNCKFINIHVVDQLPYHLIQAKLSFFKSYYVYVIIHTYIIYIHGTQIRNKLVLRNCEFINISTTRSQVAVINKVSNSLYTQIIIDNSQFLNIANQRYCGVIYNWTDSNAANISITNIQNKNRTKQDVNHVCILYKATPFHH